MASSNAASAGSFSIASRTFCFTVLSDVTPPLLAVSWHVQEPRVALQATVEPVVLRLEPDQYPRAFPCRVMTSSSFAANRR